MLQQQMRGTAALRALLGCATLLPEEINRKGVLDGQVDLAEPPNLCSYPLQVSMAPSYLSLRQQPRSPTQACNYGTLSAPRSGLTHTAQPRSFVLLLAVCVLLCVAGGAPVSVHPAAPPAWPCCCCPVPSLRGSAQHSYRYW